MSRPFSLPKVCQLSVKVKSPSECFVFTGNRVLEELLWGQGPEVLLSSRMFGLKKYADLGIVFCEVVGFAIPEKWWRGRLCV